MVQLLNTAVLLIFVSQSYSQSNFEFDWESEGRIIGGREVDIKHRPYMASLGRLLPSSGYNHFCCGSLITRRHILTAAHCYMNPDTVSLAAKLGTSNIDNSGIVKRIVEFKRHNQFNRHTLNNDIAVVTLDSPVQLSPFIYIIPLPVIRPPMFGKMGQVSGWGYTQEDGPASKTLQTVNVPIISADSCRRDSAYGRRVSDKMFCAGYLNGGRDSCRGDSGGPLVFNGEQIGIVSWGIGCSRANYPGIYTDVTQFLHWIHRNTC